MALTQRERYLAIGVGAVGVVLAGQYGFSTIRSQITAKQNSVSEARKEVEDINSLIVTGQLAGRKIEAVKPLSLPKRQELRAEYYRWLTELAENHDLENIKVDPPNGPSIKNKALEAYDFKLSGECSTEQAVELMAEYYDKNVLQSVKSLKMLPTGKRGRVKLNLTSQVAVLSFADPKQEVASGSSGRLAMTSDEYMESIMNRNPFETPNTPPKFDLSSSYKIELGDDWSLDLKTKDSENHAVDVAIASEDLPEGLEIRNGKLRWEPKEKGEVSVKLVGKDTGWPRQSVEKLIKLAVVDPPPEKKEEKKPEFDEATVTFVSSILSDSSGRHTWIRNRVAGETLVLDEGEEFEIGTVKAKVISINLREDFLELETDGNRWTIGMETSLAEAFEKSQID